MINYIKEKLKIVLCIFSHPADNNTTDNVLKYDDRYGTSLISIRCRVCSLYRNIKISHLYEVGGYFPSCTEKREEHFTFDSSFWDDVASKLLMKELTQ